MKRILDCCYAVHHHLELFSCIDAESFDTRLGQTEKDRRLMLGGPSKTIYKSYARRVNEQTTAVREIWDWVEHLSPKMGVAVDQKYIFILGGIPLSVKQYERKPDKKGVHKLINTFVKNLCVPLCEKKCARQYPNHVKKAPYNHSLSKVNWLNWNAIGAGNTAWVTKQIMDETAGGALTLDTDKAGIATRLYGISHCGTIFVIEPSKKRSVILMHALCKAGDVQCAYTLAMPDIYWRFEVGLALQKYTTPVGTTSNLLISVTKAYAGRYYNDAREIIRGKMWSNGFTTAPSEILKLEVASTLKMCHGMQVAASGSVTSAWAGTKSLDGHWGHIDHRRTKNPCHKSLTYMTVVHQAETIRYFKGAIYWFGGSEGIKKLTLDVALPCQSLWSAFESAAAKGGMRLSEWCNLTTAGQSRLLCSSSPAHNLMLQETAVQPWTVTLYKLKALKGVQAGSEKIYICAKPSQPTTRHSPERCCTQKHTFVPKKHFKEKEKYAMLF